jgi:hypothetical protein
MHGPAHQVAGWRASQAAGALPDRVAVTAIAGLSALLWAAVVRLTLWWLAGGG